MTARYRCPWCGSFTAKTALETRNHILNRHRAVLIRGLGIIETFGTREEATLHDVQEHGLSDGAPW